MEKENINQQYKYREKRKMSENSTVEEEKKVVRVFQLNDEKAEFEELDIPDDINLYDILDSELVLYFVEPARFKSFIWTP